MSAAGSEALSPQLINVIARAVHPRHGLITGFFEQSRSASAPDIRVAHAVIAPPAYFRANAPVPVQTVDAGAGAGFDRETACWAALGEAVERYAASLYWTDQVRVASANELGAAALDLRPLIRIAQARVTEFDQEAQRGWLEGKLVHGGQPVWVPASLCVLAYKAAAEHEIIAQNDSTGLACGQSYHDAVQSGLCEVIERDAFAANWLLDRAPPTLTFDEQSLRSLRPAARRALRDDRLRLTLHHLATSFGVYVLLGIADHRELGYGVVSAAASPSPIRAAEKAVAEALHGWTAACALSGRAPVETLEEIRTPADHVRFYLRPHRFERVRRLRRGDHTISFAELVEEGSQPVELATIAGNLAAEGFKAAGVDMTTVDVAELGLRVAKVIVPGLQPLVFGSACVEAPDQRRLDRWRQHWKLPPGRTLNPDPHPFP